MPHHSVQEQLALMKASREDFEAAQKALEAAQAKVGKASGRMAQIRSGDWDADRCDSTRITSNRSCVRGFSHDGPHDEGEGLRSDHFNKAWRHDWKTA